MPAHDVELRLGDALTACFWRSLEAWRKEMMPRLDQDEALAAHFHGADLTVQIAKEGKAMCFVQIMGNKPYESVASAFKLRMVRPRIWQIVRDDQPTR